MASGSVFVASASLAVETLSARAAMGARDNATRRRAGTHSPPAGAGEDRAYQKHDRWKNQPLIELDGDPALAALHFEGVEILDRGLDHRGDIHAGSGDGIAALGFRGELAHDFGLEAADDRFAAAVVHQLVREVRVRNVIAIHGSHADGEDENAGVLGLGDHFIEVALVFPRHR